MNLSASIRKLTLLFVVLFMALSAGLVYWQVIVAQRVSANPHNNRMNLPDSAPKRGRIFDRNGVLLAETLPTGNGNYIRHYTEPSLAGLIGYYAPGYRITGIEAQFNAYLNGQMGLTELNNMANKMPALTIVAMKENGGEGGNVNAPMVKKMYNDIFSKGLVKAQQPPAASATYCCQSGMLQRGPGCTDFTVNVPAKYLQQPVG